MAGVNQLRERLSGDMNSSLGSNASSVVNTGLLRRSATIFWDGEPAGDSLRSLFLIAPCPIRIISLIAYPSGTVVASDTNYATISVVHNNTAGGSDTNILTPITTKTTGGQAFVDGTFYTLTLLAAGVFVPSGYAVALYKVPTAAGVAVGPISWTLTYDIVGDAL